jgi:hypothetical protein
MTMTIGSMERGSFWGAVIKAIKEAEEDHYGGRAAKGETN